MGESEKVGEWGRLTDLGHLSAGVGHHVINAFSAIVSNAELLRLKGTMATPLDPEVLAATIVKTALDAATVARRLIDYSRLVTALDPVPGAFTPATLALEVLAADLLAEESEGGPTAVAWSSDLAPIPPIRGHAGQLRRMLGHLLQNAYEALPEGKGAIRLATATDARGWVVLELRDSGTGMSPETLEHAVEPFFSTKPAHFGVGLSIANGIWRRHKGTMAIRSHLGEGTLIRLCIEPDGGPGLPRRGDP